MAMTYLHSHVHTDIIDNSVTTTVTDGGTVGFFPIFADKGKENELVLIDSGVGTFVDTYGTDGNKFGQAQLNVRQWLIGGGSAYVMRLLPDDATYASAAVVVNVDSYLSTYKLTVALKNPFNETTDLASETYLVEEKFIFDASTVKELALYKYSVKDTNYTSVGLFRTGRGNSAESSYDVSEDWMRKNDKATEDTSGDELEAYVQNMPLEAYKKEYKREPKEDEITYLAPVKSYVNYNMVAPVDDKKTSALEQYLKVGTKALSPAATSAIISTLAESTIGNSLAIAVELNGSKDLIFTRGEPVYIMDTATGKFYTDTSKTTEVAESKVIFAKLPAGTYSVKKPGGHYDPTTDEVLDLYVPATKDLYIVNTKEIEYNVESSKFENAYAPLETGEDTVEGGSLVEHAFITSGLTVDIADALKKLAVAPFGDDIEGAEPSTCAGIKKMLFANSENINAYYSFFDTELTVPAPTDENPSATKTVQLSDFISVKAEDLAVEAQYFMDSYPIEIYSTANSKSPTGKVWNAKITITDSDGVSTDVVIFREVIKGSEEGIGEQKVNEGIPLFTQELYVYYALNALCKDRGSIYEPKRGPAFLETKGSTEYTHAKFVTDNFGNPEGSTKPVFFAVQWLNKDYLASAVYPGDLAFTRKDADKITVELYTPNRNACKTIDGIRLDINDYCTIYNNNVSNLLAGKKKYPVGYFVSNCKGEYYNNMKIYLKLNDNLKETYPDFRLYDLEVYDCANNKTQLIDGPYTVSFYKDAIDNAGGSLYIKSILDTYGKKDANGDVAVQFYDDVDTDAFEDLAKDLSSLFRLKHPKFTFNNNAVDPFFVPQVDENILSSGDPDYEYHSYMAYTDDESIPESQRSLRIQGDNNISTAQSLRLDEGFFLAGGSSGTLFDKKGNFIQSAYRQLMVQAFNGGLNAHVFDVKNYEFDVLMDAKFPKAVKIAMVQLASSLRKDCIVCLDTDNMLSNTSGPANSAQAAIDARKSINTNDYVASIWCQNSVAYDEYTDRDIPVSATYFLSYKIPFNDNANGIQTAFVGPRRGTMDLYKDISWYPTEAEKERLYKAQINYISKDPRRIAFDSQLTSQMVTSALSNIPNVRVLFKIKRAVEKICDDYRFERNTGKTRIDMEDQVNEYLKTWINNGACDTCTATVSATDYQIKQKMATVAIDIVFVGFLERIHVVINVNG